MSSVAFGFDIDGVRVNTEIDLSPLERLWARVVRSAEMSRAADAGAPRPGVARASCGCVCGAGADRVLVDGASRSCTACGETREV